MGKLRKFERPQHVPGILTNYRSIDHTLRRYYGVILDREENVVVPEHRVPEPENDFTEDAQVLGVEPF